MSRPISPLKLAFARSVGALSRRSGRGGGTSLPGKVLLRLQPDAIGRLSRGLEGGSIVVSATNGKTTTAGMIASILDHAGVHEVHNRAGANMPGGIATALLEAAPGGDVGLFEVDEAWTASLVKELRPTVIVLSNLFRDQLDRYGELETLADTWRKMIAELPPDVRVVVNADDPLLVSIADDRANAVFFGVDDRRYAEDQTRHAADSKFCRRCGSPLVYESVQLGHLGDYHCDACGFSRPHPSVAVTRVELDGMNGSRVEISIPDGAPIVVELSSPGLYNVYNAIAATAGACAAGIDRNSIEAGLAAAKTIFGRVERLEINGQDVSILLVKNPTGANEVLRTITGDSKPFDLWIALNDGVADGRDISWVWDADFEMVAGLADNITCSGTRAAEMALRLAYAGVERSAIRVDESIERSFDTAIDQASAAGARIFALPTYTSLLALRTAIARRGDAPSYWEG